MFSKFSTHRISRKILSLKSNFLWQNIFLSRDSFFMKRPRSFSIPINFYGQYQLVSKLVNFSIVLTFNHVDSFSPRPSFLSRGISVVQTHYQTGTPFYAASSATASSSRHAKIKSMASAPIIENPFRGLNTEISRSAARFSTPFSQFV